MLDSILNFRNRVVHFDVQSLEKTPAILTAIIVKFIIELDSQLNCLCKDFWSFYTVFFFANILHRYLDLVFFPSHYFTNSRFLNIKFSSCGPYALSCILHCVEC